MLICIAFFAVGSALAGASQNMASLNETLVCCLLTMFPFYSP